MDDFPSNARRETRSIPVREPAKNIEKVVTGEVVQRKKSLGKRFKETFVGGNAKGVWEYVTLDVMIPAAKNMFADAITEGFERMIFGDSRPSSRRHGSRSGGANGYVSYNRYSSHGPAPISHRDEPRPISRRARASHDFDEIILETRVEAEVVIDHLFEVVSKYETATVADLYDMVGIDGKYTDDKWGWTDLRGAGVTRVRNGYLLDLPKPEPID